MGGGAVASHHMPTAIMTTSFGGREQLDGGRMEEEGRLEVFSQLADLDVITPDDEAEIDRFRAFASEAPGRRPGAWLRSPLHRVRHV